MTPTLKDIQKMKYTMDSNNIPPEGREMWLTLAQHKALLADVEVLNYMKPIKPLKILGITVYVEATEI